MVGGFRSAIEAVFRLVLDLGGALSGEHGIGTEKMAYIGQEIDTVTLDYMKRIKNLFDPNDILNPGKVLLAPQPPGRASCDEAPG